MAKDSFWEKYRDRRWQEKRLRIMERAKFCCEMCGSADNATQLHIHHGYYRSKADPWDYPDDTLWCLCEPCHGIAGDIKHDCQIELARINPAVLGIAFRMIYELRKELRNAQGGSCDSSELAARLKALEIPNGVRLAQGPEV